MCLLSTYTLKAIFTLICKIYASYNTFERNNLILDHLSRGMSLTTRYRHRLVKLAIFFFFWMGTQNGHNVPFLKSASLGKRKRKATKRIKQIGKDSFYPPLSFFYREYVFLMYFLITRLFFLLWRFSWKCIISEIWFFEILKSIG